MTSNSIQKSKNMKPDFLYNRLVDFFNRSGFNIVCRTRANEYDLQVPSNRRVTNLLPNAKSVILIGFAGRNFWETLQRFFRENPEFRDTREDWIDDYTLLWFMSAAQILEDEKVTHKMAFPFGSGELSLDFSRLGELGGVGVKSLMGILIHPEYGLWVSLRGAIIT